MKTIDTYIHDGGRVGDGFGAEKLDCAVRAYAIAKEIPYTDAHLLFEKAGRRPQHRTYWEIYTKLRIKFTFRYITVKNFIIQHPEGSFYVCMNGHAFVIKNGVIFDNRKLSGRIVIKRWFEVK